MRLCKNGNRNGVMQSLGRTGLDGLIFRTRPEVAVQPKKTANLRNVIISVYLLY